MTASVAATRNSTIYTAASTDSLLDGDSLTASYKLETKVVNSSLTKVFPYYSTNSFVSY